MNLLESAMAFAVVMIIFSTLITGIVEAILRALGTRERNLRNTVEALFVRVVWPRLQPSLPGLDPADTDNVQRKPGIIEKIRVNALQWLGFGAVSEPADTIPFTAHSASATPLEAERFRRHKIRFIKDLTENPVSEPGGKYSVERKSRIDALTLLAFAERLGKSEVGKAIAAEGEAQVELLIKDLARSFDRFGRAASEVFRKKAQLTAICVAIPFAWMVNIDAARLLDQLINNPEIRSSLIQQADTANRENLAAIKSLQELQARLEAQQAGQDPVPGDDSASATASLQQQLKEATDQVSEAMQKLNEQGLKVGWKYYPYCARGHSDAACNGRVGLIWPDNNKEADTGSSESESDNTLDIEPYLQFASWLFMSTLAGLLIGLGGPFWFRVFTGLSQAFQALKSLGIGGRKTTSAEPPPADKLAENAARPKDVLDAFKVAVAVNLESTAGKPGRALLSPDGQNL